jgi:hypothetical protein
MNLEDYKNTVETFGILISKNQINTTDKPLSKLSTIYKNDLLLAFFEDKEIMLGESENMYVDKQRCVLLGYKSLSYIIRALHYPFSVSIPDYSCAPDEIWEEFYCDIDDIFQDYCRVLSDTFEV